MVRWLVAVVAGLVAVVAVPVPQRAWAAPCLGAKPVVSAVPAELKAYAPARLAGLATGAGVRVAVVDSGVDVRHPQLRGHVAAGRDFLRNEFAGRRDCVGHGTGVAGIIAAGADAGSGVQGLAPGATIVPVRVSEQQDIDETAATSSGGSAQTFAEGIRWAAGPGRAQVINISLVMPQESTAVRLAIADAVAAGVIVVAAAGNDGPEAGVVYPAAFPGVIGVGAVGADGLRASYSQVGAHVDVVAFGDRVTVASPVAGHQVVQGTSFAAPFVTATVALLKQRFPRESAEQITRRLLRSVDPAPGGARSDEYGYGLLNPYRALTEEAGPVVAAAPVSHAAPRRVSDASEWVRAGWFAAGGAGLAVLAGVVAVVVGRGRRRGWRAGHDRMPG
ncbi:S8 family serine peptidase [Actinoplanes flavus]|uniref:S8 family serine peptidase n=1 Tax=Actinoplanes flavus TaxID=2820290 RepID=UPI0027DBBC34|nr:S8 family serine peptidase [Actinoplanes flavus]